MKTLAFTIALLAVPATNGLAQDVPTLKPDLAGVAFLLGDWIGGQGQVADTGGTSTGTSRITAEAGGAVLLRRDHTILLDAKGNPAGSFDQLMTIYPQAGTLHADYFDGAHIIHYTTARIVPGQSVIFTTAAAPGVRSFQLSYMLTNPSRLSVAFAMAPPGVQQFRPIATGTLRRPL